MHITIIWSRRIQQAVTNFSKTMEMLNPPCTDDKRLVLQATDYPKNVG
jgi:hypothetical protein